MSEPVQPERRDSLADEVRRAAGDGEADTVLQVVDFDGRPLARGILHTGAAAEDSAIVWEPDGPGGRPDASSA